MLLICFPIALSGALRIETGASSIARSRSNALPWLANQDAYFAAAPYYFGCFDGVSSAGASRAFAMILGSPHQFSVRLFLNGLGTDRNVAQSFGPR